MTVLSGDLSSCSAQETVIGPDLAAQCPSLHVGHGRLNGAIPLP